ncbi:hypothetical protein [Streptomonospora salina]|uniref:Sulfotransferase family protein n=1 Tax=Streptomonospora salina TaxID=104205 RepID=A0A841E1J8_9ACTN|nr:hypothetical protein [Streptomonospora salina]MBB5996916.1 hypothetical protein [Streptomonospora salina]
MRVFVLCTGRCGSVTLATACGELTDFTVGHESRSRLVGDERLAFPDQHVEVDNRLSWFLGELDERYGDDPLYVHLRRDPELVAHSYARRWDSGDPAGIIRAFAGGVVMRRKSWPQEQRLEVSRYYVRTVTANIEAFLADKSRQMTVWLDEVEEWFPVFWERLGGRGDCDAALKHFEVRHNAS